jgi:hypothetical protein
MNWPITLCLAGGTVVALIFLVILREIIRELFAPRVLPGYRDTAMSRHEVEIRPRDDVIIQPSEEDRIAKLMLRHSFVATMMEQYQAIGDQRDVIDFINDELCKRNATWRVRALPNGSGEFYDYVPRKTLINRIALFKGRAASSG